MTSARVVVVGGSIAGVQTAQNLRQLGFDGSLSVLGDELHQPYQRPPLSKAVLAGTRTPESTAISIGPTDAAVELGASAVGLNRSARVVVTSDGRRWPYDHLVVATGARARRLTEEPEEHVLRTMDDALRLRASLHGKRRLLIIGGGFLGMEVASTCVSLGVEVTVVDQQPPLQRLVGSTLAAWICERARSHGVRIMQVEPRGARLVRRDDGWLYQAGEVQVTADVALTAVGDIPNTEWLAGTGLEVSPGLRVDPFGRAGDGVYGVGDVTARRSADGTWQRTPFWSAALEQAHQVAHTILGIATPPAAGAGYYWSEQFGLDLRLCGQFPPTGAALELIGSLGSGSAVLGWPETSGLETSRHSTSGSGGLAEGRVDANVMATVAAINHRTPVGHLKRWLTSVPIEKAAPAPLH